MMGKKRGAVGATEGLGSPLPGQRRPEGLRVCEDFLEEEDPHKPPTVAGPCRKFMNGRCLT